MPTGAAGQVIVGHDVSVYSLINFGVDGTPGAGASQSLLGRWKKITVRVKATWETVSSSDALLEERRFIINDWSATLESQQRIASTGASTALSLALQSEVGQLAHVIFTEATTGQTINLYGGIETAELSRDRGESSDTLELICVGGIGPGAASILYA